MNLLLLTFPLIIGKLRSILLLSFNYSNRPYLTPLNMQIQVSYEKQGSRYLRVFNCTFKSSTNPLVFYKGLDAGCISIILLRKYLKYAKNKPVKRVGNSMLDYFESMVSDYKNSREEFFSQEKTDSDKIEEYIGCSMTA